MSVAEVTGASFCGLEAPTLTFFAIRTLLLSIRMRARAIFSFDRSCEILEVAMCLWAVEIS
jgi:hypothetical protein